MNPEMELSTVPERFVPALCADADRIVEVLTDADTSVAVPDCPDWDVAALVTHLGAVHRWATTALTSGAAGRLERVEVPSDELASWFAEGADLLITALRAADPTAPSWHPFDDEQIAAVWFRRQAHETAVHRVDIERAVAEPTPIPPALASDGIDEHLELGWSRAIARATVPIPAGSVHLHCTDVAGEWLVWDDGGRIGLRREHTKGDAAVRGPAESILLHLLGRADGRPELAVDVIGDADVAAAWFALPAP